MYPLIISQFCLNIIFILSYEVSLLRTFIRLMNRCLTVTYFVYEVVSLSRYERYLQSGDVTVALRKLTCQIAKLLQGACSTGLCLNWQHVTKCSNSSKAFYGLTIL
jgi:hypothetical protein